LGIALLMAVAVGAVAHAGAAQVMATVYGYGTESCGEWLHTSAEPQGWSHLVDSSWVMGFVTAADVYAPKGATFRKSDAAGLDAYMTTYCRAHPLDTIVTAATALVRELTAGPR